MPGEFAGSKTKKIYASVGFCNQSQTGCEFIYNCLEWQILLNPDDFTQLFICFSSASELDKRKIFLLLYWNTIGPSHPHYHHGHAIQTDDAAGHRGNGLKKWCRLSPIYFLAYLNIRPSHHHCNVLFVPGGFLAEYTPWPDGLLRDTDGG